MPSTQAETAPSYATSVATLYDETHRGKWAGLAQPSIASMGNRANLIGFLEHHSNDTDGSFAICMAGGSGNFISKQLYDAIPGEHKPVLNTQDKAPVSFLMGDSQESIGSIIMPFLLTNKQTRMRFRIKLYAHVLPNLLMGMFIGTNPETNP